MTAGVLAGLPMLPALSTARLLLRPLREGDAADMHRLFGDAEAMRFWDNVPAPAPAETARRLAAFLSLPAHWAGAWHVRDRAGDFVGAVFYHHREVWNCRLEMGWMLLPACWGRGLMSEAAAAVLAHAFAPVKTGGMGVHRAEALVEPANRRSIALAERLGFRLEGGPLRGRLLVGGVFRDQLMFGLLAGDFAARPGRPAG